MCEPVRPSHLNTMKNVVILYNLRYKSYFKQQTIMQRFVLSTQGFGSAHRSESNCQCHRHRCTVEIAPGCQPVYLPPVYQIMIRCTGDQYVTSLGVGPVPCRPDAGVVQELITLSESAAPCEE